MMFPIGRRHQIDYMFGLRYAFSPAYRDKVRKNCVNSPSLRLLYTFGGLISIAVVLSAVGLMTLAISGLLQ